MAAVRAEQLLEPVVGVDLARQAVAQHPQDLVPDVRLQAVERQDRAPLPGQNAAQAVVVGERGGRRSPS